MGKIDTDYRLDDRYTRTEGRVFLSGSQALVRLPMMQRQRDLAVGLNTAGFISGYTGSPLGGYDIALNQIPELLAQHHIHFQPAINEDLGATAVWGSQQVHLAGQARYDGVFGIWYGKGPGVDRSGDALKHGSYSGSAPKGGVLVLAGDDHGAKSSTIAHQSDHAFIHFAMPYFNPATVQDYLDYGLHGFALSRYSGCWVGMKCVTDTIESSASVDVDPDRIRTVLPNVDAGGAGLSTRWGVPALVAEKRQYQERLPAVLAYVKLNGLNRTVVASPVPRLGIVTTGKAFLDVMQALEDLGLSLKDCEAIGLSVLKIAMPWPLESSSLLDFAVNQQELLVIEEKRPVIEEQIARLLVNLTQRPRLFGKQDEDGLPLVPAEGELAPRLVAKIVGERIFTLTGDDRVARALDRMRRADADVATSGASLVRLPSFCAGCPHNRSTKVPEGSMAFGGIGCHGMATFLPERSTPTLFQMGGEGASWIGMAPFTERSHIFQNLGDGTYYHSGLLAIRAAAAANINITYKILVNDAIAMTGGQEIAGKMRVDVLTRQLEAEGVRAIAVVSDQPESYPKDAIFAPGTTIHHRRELDDVQRRMRDISGVTAIVYDQNCATELRRRRKRGRAVDPDHRPFINSRVCEGCGDCSVQSNCIAIEPVETDFGRKRRINQSACNKDLSCVDGYCPSFVTVKGGRLRKRAGSGSASNGEHIAATLPIPACAPVETPFNLLITGIGGSGVVTLGAILGMAAHLEGKGSSVLDVTGLAQRNGPVTSHVRIGASPDALHATRIGGADLVIGSDIVVTASPAVLNILSPGHTRAIINNHVSPTSDFATNPDLNLSAGAMEEMIEARTGEVEFIEANRVAYTLMGNEVAANLMLVGYAAQRGWLPISIPAIDRAIELNGASVEMNRQALAWGRIAAAQPERLSSLVSPVSENRENTNVDQIVERNAAELHAYQDTRYAERYRRLVTIAGLAETRLGVDSTAFARAVAKNHFKLLAYKDEYEVARLLTGTAFADTLSETFDGDFQIEYNMAPPFLQRRDPQTGRYPKRRFGAWMTPVLKLLACGKGLRGTVFDPFGYAAHRRTERALIAEYERDIIRLADELTEDRLALSVEIASLPEGIRGFDTVKEVSMAEARQKKRLLEQELEGAANTAARQNDGKQHEQA